jgi:hypothetical protein
MMALFRLLHASDFHIARTPYWAGTPANPWLARLTRVWRQRSHDPFVLEAFAQWLLWNGGFSIGPEFETGNGPLFDAILLTGDMATTGELADLREAYDFVDAQPNFGGYLSAAGKPTIAFANPNRLVKLIPGNHDRFRSALSLYLPGGTTFDSVFCPSAGNGNPYWCGNQGFSFDGGPTRGKASVLIWRIDFSLGSKDRGKRYYGLPGWLGQGRVLKKILYGPNGTPANVHPASLVRQTQSYRHDAINHGLKPVVIWAIHFDPFSTDGLLELLDSDLLVGATEQAGVSAILCGHTHESKVKPLSSSTAVFVCGTTSAAGDVTHNDFQVLEIDVPEAEPRVPTFRVMWYRYSPAHQKGGGVFSKVMTVETKAERS